MLGKIELSGLFYVIIVYYKSLVKKSKLDTTDKDETSSDNAIYMSTASRPIPLSEWAASPDLFDYPTPIGKKLSMLSKLFRADWLSPSGEYGIDGHCKFNANGMKKLFEERMSSYCKLMLDIECTKLKGIKVSHYNMNITSEVKTPLKCIKS